MTINETFNLDATQAIIKTAKLLQEDNNND
jgi:hypothetical protein